jgi:nicotinamidase-related amidase
MANAIIITDMLRGFLEEGYPLFISARARWIIPNIQGLLDQELARGSKVFSSVITMTPMTLSSRYFHPTALPALFSQR